MRFNRNSESLLKAGVVLRSEDCWEPSKALSAGDSDLGKSLDGDKA